MSQNDYTLTIGQLEENFKREGAPYWEAFRGDRQSERLGKFRPDSSMARTPEEVMVFSWMQLEDLLTRYPRGSAKIVARVNKTDNRTSAITSHVRWGDQVAGIGSTYPERVGQQLNAGPSWAQLLKMQEDSHKREIDLVKDLIEAKFSRDQLEAELEGTGEPSIRDAMIMKGMELLPVILSSNRSAPGHLGLISEAPETETPLSMTPPASQEHATPPPPATRSISHDQLGIAANMIAAAIPGHHPNDVIAALALFCQQKPAEAAGYVDLLMSQIKRPDNG